MKDTTFPHTSVPSHSFPTHKPFVDISSQHLRTVAERLKTICTKTHSLLSCLILLLRKKNPICQEEIFAANMTSGIPASHSCESKLLRQKLTRPLPNRCVCRISRRPFVSRTLCKPGTEDSETAIPCCAVTQVQL